MRLLPRSLFFRLSLAVSAVLIVVFGTSSYVIFSKQSDQALEATRTQAVLLTRALKNTIRIGMESGHANSLVSIFHTVGSLPGVEKMRIFDEDGLILYSAKFQEIGRLTDELDYDTYRKPGSDRSTPFTSEDTGHRSFCMVEPIENEPQCRRCHDKGKEVLGVLDVCLSMEETERKIEENRFLMLSSTGLAIVLCSMFVSFLVNRFVSAPVARMARAMEAVQGGNLEARADERGGSELGSLAHSFNEMVGRLAEAQEELERLHHRQLARADRLASLGEMAAGIAHEIKNPLAGIYGSAQVLARDFPEGDPRREVVEEMMNLVKRLDNTIKDILNFSRYTEPTFSRGNLNDVIDKVLFLVQQIREGKRAVFLREYDPAMPEVEMDQEQVKQVFLNLVLNALQAGPDGVTVTVRTCSEVPPDVPDVKHRSRYVMASVSDDGPGIPPDKVGKIFHPFFTTKESGTGLGLSMTRKILDLHDGWITVASTPGKGSTFSVFLPKEKL